MRTPVTGLTYERTMAAGLIARQEGDMAARLEPTQEIVEAAIAAAGSDDDRTGSEMAIDIMKAVLAALSPAGTVTPPENKDLAEDRC